MGTPEAAYWGWRKLRDTNNILAVIVVDQASIHTGGLIWDYLEEWEERGIEIFILPSYSPELNLIENLVSSVEDILSNYGTKYVINFV